MAYCPFNLFSSLSLLPTARWKLSRHQSWKAPWLALPCVRTPSSCVYRIVALQLFYVSQPQQYRTCTGVALAPRAPGKSPGFGASGVNDGQDQQNNCDQPVADPCCNVYGVLITILFKSVERKKDREQTSFLEHTVTALTRIWCTNYL